MKTIERLLEETGLTIDEIAEKAGLSIDRVEAIAVVDRSLVKKQRAGKATAAGSTRIK